MLLVSEASIGRLCSPPILLSSGCWGLLLLRKSGRSVMFTIHLHLVLRLGMPKTK